MNSRVIALLSRRENNDKSFIMSHSLNDEFYMSPLCSSVRHCAWGVCDNEMGQTFRVLNQLYGQGQSPSKLI